MTLNHGEPEFPTKTLSESTAIGSQKEISKTNQIEVVLSKREVGPSTETSAVLEAQLAQEKAERKKERFFSLFAFILVADYYVGINAGWWPYTVVTILLVIFLIGMANWMEVPWVVRHLEALFAMLSRRLSGKTDEGNEPE